MAVHALIAKFECIQCRKKYEIISPCCNELVPEGIFSDILDNIKRKIFFAVIPKSKIKDAIIAIVENVESIAQRIVAETGQTAKDWVETNIDLLIDRIASFIGLVAIPETGVDGEMCYTVVETNECLVPESPENATIIIMVVQFLIPIFIDWFRNRK